MEMDLARQTGRTEGDGTYVGVARRGGHQWWRYLLGLAIILFAYIVVANAGSALVAFAFDGQEGIAAFGRVDLAAFGPVGGFVVIMAGWPFVLAAILLAVTLVHRRHPRTLVTAGKNVNWRRVGQGFLAWFLPWCLIGGLGQHLLYPDTFFLTSDLVTLALFVPVALVLTAVQTTTEELLFRGYLVQSASIIWTNRVFLALVSAVIFTLPHLTNAEAQQGGWLTVFLSYFVGMGLVWVVVSLIDGTTELAIGAHFANNIAAVLLFSATGGTFAAPALFSISGYHATFYDLSNLVLVPVFLVIVFLVGRKKRRRSSFPPDGDAKRQSSLVGRPRRAAQHALR